MKEKPKKQGGGRAEAIVKGWELNDFAEHLSSVSCNLFRASVLATPCLVVAVQPCMKWIPIKKKIKTVKGTNN